MSAQTKTTSAQNLIPRIHRNMLTDEIKSGKVDKIKVDVILENTSHLSRADFAIFQYLRRNVNKFNPSIGFMADMTGYSPRQVRKSLIKFEKLGLVKKTYFDEIGQSVRVDLGSYFEWRLSDRDSILARRFKMAIVRGLDASEKGLNKRSSPPNDTQEIPPGAATVPEAPGQLRGGTNVPPNKVKGEEENNIKNTGEKSGTAPQSPDLGVGDVTIPPAGKISKNKLDRAIEQGVLGVLNRDDRKDLRNLLLKHWQPEEILSVMEFRAGHPDFARQTMRNTHTFPLGLAYRRLLRSLNYWLELQAFTTPFRFPTDSAATTRQPGDTGESYPEPHIETCEVSEPCLEPILAEPSQPAAEPEKPAVAKPEPQDLKKLLSDLAGGTPFGGKPLKRWRND